MEDKRVKQPTKRGALRKFLGKEFFILKRKLIWAMNWGKYAKVNLNTSLPNSLIKHRSMLLRPLKNVDMQLQHNKITNLKLASDKINGVLIRPGEIFSIWRLVGRPTSSKGYLEGLILDSGKISRGTGGGLCQLGNLIYWMALHTPLTITERWRHGYDVFPDVNRTIPFACGATLSYNYIDLQIKNNTDKIFQINLWLDNEYLNGEITCSEELIESYTIFESDHEIRPQSWGAYTRHNKIWRRKSDKKSGRTEDELVSTNHAIMMYNPLIEKGS